MDLSGLRRIATAESSHIGVPAWEGILATLASGHQGFGNVMLTLKIQAKLMEAEPCVFPPVSGGWGKWAYRCACCRCH